MEIVSGADISECGKYRYSLWRIWDDTKQKVLFICLNPSTADADNDDATIRRCIGYAKSWGYGGVYMGNLFAFRAREPKDMKSATDPVGPENNRYLRELSNTCEMIICGWGGDGGYQDRSSYVIKNRILPIKVHYLKMNKSGEPGHPLYLKKSLKPQPYWS